MAATKGSVKRNVAKRIADGIDERYQLAGPVRKEASHVFPKHHSFLWGELALYSFIVLVLTGTYLAFFFVPDTTEVTYHGSYEPLQGLPMSRAYQSAVDLSFEVPAGLFIRQMHHWAALIYVASIVLHMFRNYFTGAFRKPREITWVTGALLLALSLPEGYMGYSMLDDLLSGIGVRIISGLVLSIPVVGTWVHWLVWGSGFEGDIWISRFFVAHVFLIPAILVALIAVHLALVWYQKHTQYPTVGARERNVIGDRTVPGFGTRTLANGLCVAGVLGLMGAIFQINPIYLWGPYTPAASSSGVQPDWYLGFFIGALRLFPRWEIWIGEYTVPPAFWAGLFVPVVMIFILAIVPFIERVITKDRRRHHTLDRPRDNAVRTGAGAMGIVFYGVLLFAGGDDVWSIGLNVPFEWIVWGGRVGILVLPPVVYLITYRICRGLQREDREILRRGVRTGVLEERDGGYYVEARQPPGGVDHEGRPIPLIYGGTKVDRTVAIEKGEEGE